MTPEEQDWLRTDMQTAAVLGADALFSSATELRRSTLSSIDRLTEGLQAMRKGLTK